MLDGIFAPEVFTWMHYKITSIVHILTKKSRTFSEFSLEEFAIFPGFMAFHFF